MTRHILLLLVALCCFSCGSKQTRDIEVIPGEARLSIDGLFQNVGSVSSKETNKVIEFTFVNSGSLPLEIQKVETHCDCTTVDYPKAPLASKEEGKIIVKLDATDIAEGDFMRSVSVYSNSSNSPKVDLFIEGKIVK